MNLSKLVAALDAEVPDAAAQVEIMQLAYDSRRVEPGTLFFCVPGERSDGHDFAADAVAKGAAALVTERSLGLDVPEVIVSDARAAMAPVAARFNDDPSDELDILAVTGTNGKTTTAWLLRDVIELCQGGVGLIGTIANVVGGFKEEAARTTPEAIDLQAAFSRMLATGDRSCVIEASSHALALHRCDTIKYAAAVFTNLTQDHLDFHRDMEDYFQAKRRLFELAPGVGVINIDDEYGRRLEAEFGGITFSASGNPKADLRAEKVEFDASGARFELVGEELAGKGWGRSERLPVQIGMPGHFNVANALGAIGAATLMGITPPDAVKALARAASVPGRFEPVDRGQDFIVLVDYAHTADSLTNVLDAARRLGEGRLISVFGAGGDRDRAKRPKMGRAAGDASDLVFLTSDNPRSERPEDILAELRAGAEQSSAEVEVVVDRRAGIAAALAEARPGDVVVIAGKGHEQGQEFEDGRKVPFDDREVAGRLLERLKSERGGTIQYEGC